MESIGRYKILNELGRGGMATVYIAHDPRFERDVAIKVLPSQFMHDPRFLERFQQEARTIAALEHFAIVPVYDFGEEGDAPFLVMRYMSGGSLRERLTGKPLPLTEVSMILDRLAKALDRAHERGIIHRDLKPGNVLFDEDNLPYLADFGIARMAEATHTMTVVGTPAYMSPEQVQGQVKLDWRSDIYALGVMLFELLTGKQPFQAETPTGQMFMHVMEPVPDMLASNPELSLEAQAIIEKSMAKDRDERYQTADALAEAVRQLIDEPLATIAPSAATLAAPTIAEVEAASESLEADDVTVGDDADQATMVDVKPPDGGEKAVEVDADPDPIPSFPKPEQPAKIPAWLKWAGGILLVLLLIGGFWMIFGSGLSGEPGLEPETEVALQTRSAEATAFMESVVNVTAAAEATLEDEANLEQTAASEAAAIVDGTATLEADVLPPVNEPVTLHVNWGVDLDLDPSLAFRADAESAAAALFPSLTQSDPVSGEPLPNLARNWDVNEDATEFTFYLRDDIPWVQYFPSSHTWAPVFDNNREARLVNADDVVYGIKRSIDPETESPNGYLLNDISNALALRNGEQGITLDDLGVVAVDEWTVRISLDKSSASFPSVAAMAMVSAQPRWVIEEWGEDWTKAGRIATYGPYGLAEWVPDSQLELIKNRYWPDIGEVQIERIVGPMTSDEAAILALYEKHEMDTFGVSRSEPGYSQAAAVLGDEWVNEQVGCTYYYAINDKKPPFDDVRARTAFVQAVDRQSLVAEILQGDEIAATSFGAPGFYGAPAPGKVGLTFDPAGAQSIFQQYLAESGQTGNDLGVRLMVTDSATDTDSAAAIAQNWHDTLGVPVEVEVKDWGDFLDATRGNADLADAPHMWRFATCAEFADEIRWLQLFEASSANPLRRNCVDNACGDAGDSDLVRLIAAAEAENDTDKRFGLYTEAETVMAVDDAAYLPLYHYTQSFAVKPWLERVFPVTGDVRFSLWSIDQAAKLEATGDR